VAIRKKEGKESRVMSPRGEEGWEEQLRKKGALEGEDVYCCWRIVSSAETPMRKREFCSPLGSGGGKTAAGEQNNGEHLGRD